MIKKDCKYYPCHKGLEDCRFCYCPLYPCQDQSLGEWVTNFKNGKIWDCSRCIKFHGKDARTKMKKEKNDIYLRERNNG